MLMAYSVATIYVYSLLFCMCSNLQL